MSRQTFACALVVLPVALTSLAGVALAKKGHKAHEHGAVNLSVAIDGTAVNISAEIPGDDAFGFEHPARSDKEKQVINDALTTFRTKGTELFQLPADAVCTVKEATIKAAQEASAAKTPPAAAKGKAAQPDEHADVDADYTFTCQKSPVGGTLKLGLLKAFPRIKTVRAQVISGQNQSGATVHTADEPIKL